MKNIILILSLSFMYILTVSSQEQPSDSLWAEPSDFGKSMDAIDEDPNVEKKEDVMKELIIPEGTKRMRDVEVARPEAIEKMVIPGSIEIVDGYLVHQCPHLREVVIQEGVRRIETVAFRDCEKLKVIVIPESVTEIGAYAFENCGFEAFEWPKTVTTMADGVLRYCKRLKRVTIPAEVKHIGKEAFCVCEKLDKVVIPDGVTEIKEGTFNGCDSLKEITIPNSVTQIDVDAFRGCGFETFVWPKQVKELKGGVFEYCGKLEKIDLPDDLTVIGYNAFRYSSIRSIVIPSKIESFLETGILKWDNNDSLSYSTVAIKNDKFDFDRHNRFCESEHRLNYDQSTQIFIWDGDVSKVRRTDIFKKLLADFCIGTEMGYTYSEETIARNRRLIVEYYSDKHIFSPLRPVPYAIALGVMVPVNVLFKVATFPLLYVRDLGKAFSNSSNYDAYFDGLIRDSKKRKDFFSEKETHLEKVDGDYKYVTTKGMANLPYAHNAIIRYMMKERLLTEEGANLCLKEMSEDNPLFEEMKGYVGALK